MYRSALYGIILLSVLLTGCASDPQKHQSIVEKSAEIIQPPHEKLSNFSHFELGPMKVADGIESDAAKKEYADILEKNLSLNLSSLIDEWNQAPNEASRNLLIEPELLSLRIVSGGARFWAGALVGNSSIKLKLNIIDADSKSVIGSPVIFKESNSMAGAWSVGATDQNLLTYVVDISEQYLKNNF